MDHPSFVELQNRRNSILEQIAGPGDFRPSDLAQRHRKFGNPSCHCAQPGTMSHGPIWTLTRKARNQESVHRPVPEEALGGAREQLRKTNASTATPKQGSVNGTGF